MIDLAERAYPILGIEEALAPVPEGTASDDFALHPLYLRIYTHLNGCYVQSLAKSASAFESPISFEGPTARTLTCNI